jgi:hypothetical protein
VPLLATETPSVEAALAAKYIAVAVELSNSPPVLVRLERRWLVVAYTVAR